MHLTCRTCVTRVSISLKSICASNLKTSRYVYLFMLFVLKIVSLDARHNCGESSRQTVLKQREELSLVNLAGWWLNFRV